MLLAVLWKRWYKYHGDSDQKKKPSEDKECLDFLITQGVKLIILKEKISLLTKKIAEKGLTF